VGESEGEECREGFRERLSRSSFLINSLRESESESGSGVEVRVRFVEDVCKHRRLVEIVYSFVMTSRIEESIPPVTSQSYLVSLSQESLV
jgi:hypothetical protein